MKKIRIYGKKPSNIAVLHGGPGAPGEMAPVAKKLSIDRGILEPLQSSDSVDGQILELKAILDEYGTAPFTLIGYSWGAWLAYLFTAKYQILVKKLILIGSGPFEEKYTKGMMETRLKRLTTEERKEVEEIMTQLSDGKEEGMSDLFSRFGKLMSKADAYDPFLRNDDTIEVQPQVYEGVWPTAAEMRKSGELLTLGRKIDCPVVAIHGTHDPHPYNGVKVPLFDTIKDFKFILLENCGHKPWIEKQAREEFFEVLKREIEK